MDVVLAGDGVTYFSMDDNQDRRWVKFFKIEA